jgi:hypothetical protein
MTAIPLDSAAFAAVRHNCRSTARHPQEIFDKTGRAARNLPPGSVVNQVPAASHEAKYTMPANYA